MLHGRPSFIRFLAGGGIARRFQEPPLRSVAQRLLVVVSLPPGKARLRQRILVVSELGV
jgi:hypothetical protein